MRRGETRGDLGEDRCLVAHREVAQVDLVGAVDVATRVDGEEVKDVVDAERGQRGGALVPDVTQLGDRHVAQLAKPTRRRVAHSSPK